jgi:Skp family chaperone for outer membrane proteins
METRRCVAALGLALAIGATLATTTGSALMALGEFNSGSVVAQDCPPETCGKSAPLQNPERW